MVTTRLGTSPSCATRGLYQESEPEKRSHPLLNMLARLILVCCLVALAVARPQGPARPPAEILEYENNNIGVDGYNFRFQTSDGVSRSETGVLNNAGTENEEMTVNGEISFTTDDGKKVTITFVSDGNGYRPVVTTS
ncbi:endocuticle structural glycoprotein ABD-5-like [Homalodisca vitripennis]|uniref:endocuticle structural glycoprotein ABD-5-like n=1 Tax=Homalodisca vitripennis TaxID=197043 RepID=UPI001EEBEBAA|nr:endocuticle structural glycoprotein ABD-5-like [Homalodisca vitripennis]